MKLQPDKSDVQSISGYGLPLSVLLLRPSLDKWKPGAHTGTFRANQLALTAGTAALGYWSDKAFLDSLKTSAKFLREHLQDTLTNIAAVELRTIGMLAGVDLLRRGRNEVAKRVQERCFELGLSMNITALRGMGGVFRIAPPLTITDDELDLGLAILDQAIADVAH